MDILQVPIESLFEFGSPALASERRFAPIPSLFGLSVVDLFLSGSLAPCDSTDDIQLQLNSITNSNHGDSSTHSRGTRRLIQIRCRQ